VPIGLLECLNLIEPGAMGPRARALTCSGSYRLVVHAGPRRMTSAGCARISLSCECEPSADWVTYRSIVLIIYYPKTSSISLLLPSHRLPAPSPQIVPVCIELLSAKEHRP
jgi:hypothetical protein